MHSKDKPTYLKKNTLLVHAHIQIIKSVQICAKLHKFNIIKIKPMSIKMYKLTCAPIVVLDQPAQSDESLQWAVCG